MASGAKKALTHVISAIKRDYILQILIKIILKFITLMVLSEKYATGRENMTRQSFCRYSILQPEEGTESAISLMRKPFL